MPMREDVYREEGTEAQQLHPYLVTQFNYKVQCIQHKHKEKYSVFFPHESEKLVFHYERNPLDPRITHTIHTDIDQYGNVKQSAAIVYGRKQADPNLPTQADREVQLKQHITYSSHLFTNKIETPQAYRLPVNWKSQTWELNTAAPNDTFYIGEEIMERYANAGIKQYEETTGLNEKRMIEQAAVLFQRDDLSGAEAPGNMGTLGLPYENYLMAFTPGLVNDIYGNRVTDNLLRDKGKYVEFENDNNYWIRSGKIYFHPDLTANPFVKVINPPSAADLLFAKSNFYQPVAYEDNSGNLTKAFYDPFRIAVKRRIDAADNDINIDVFHYRTLAPCRVRDENDNISGVRFDELGLVTHTFAMGKDNEFQGDLMDPATIETSINDRPGSVLEYEFRYFNSNGLLPDRAKISVREKHHFKGTIGVNGPDVENDTRSQITYSYSDGSGHEVLKKVQAEPGLAPVRDAQGKLVKDASGKLQLADTAPGLRWVGNGRTISNNKGNPVKQYEPFFDSVPEYNDESELVELGCTKIIIYDALSRVIKKEFPNGTFTKVEFDAWMQKKWDENDTVLDDACQWYKDRINGAKGPAEQQAAQKSALHYNTPSVEYLDAQAHIFLHTDHNKTQRTGEAVQEKFHYTRNYFDIEGNTLRVTHTKNAVETEVMNWRYDMLGNISRQHSSDSGDRWILHEASGKPLRLWDSRNNIFIYEYDPLERLLSILVENGAGEKLLEKIEYGESPADAKIKNLRGKRFRHFDTGGLMVNEQFDFKANGLRTTRQLPVIYKGTPDWKTAMVDNEMFAHETSFDAMNRPILLKHPDNSVITSVYNEAGLLNRLDVNIKGVNTTTHFITNINYNAKGQREKIEYGNDTGNTITTTTYQYEPETYRLVQLLTTRNSDNTVLQDLNYTYDPEGNITRQFDNAQKTIFYGGQKVAAENNYIYDALYQLVEANGREHIGQVGLNTQDNWNDSWAGISLQPGSPVQLRNYTQKYAYDEAGNIMEMRHIAGPASFTRTYQYNAFNNQLTRTEVGVQGYDYLYNQHGSIRTMPHLQPGTESDWNEREEMQHIQLGGGGEAWYQYDDAGQRIRKVVEKNQQREERIYLGGLEIYRVYENATGNKILERETLHVIDDKRRIAMVDTRTAGNDGSPQQLIRFQYNDHLQSACLEMDEQAAIICYEEFHPFGTTAYQATDASREVPAKRYRYTGMERDEESGFNYHHARYYIPWLARWLSADPIGIGDGLNVYAYLSINPIVYHDQDGTKAKPKKKTAPADDTKKPAQKKADSKAPKKPPPKKTDDAGTGKLLIVMHNSPKKEKSTEFDQNIDAAKKAGYKVITVKNGKELIDTLKKAGPIKKLTILSHGVPTGLGGEGDNSGLYVGENRAGHDGKNPLGKGGATVDELKKSVDKKEIVFDPNATITIAGCRTASAASEEQKDTLAGKVATATGKEVSASSGRTSPGAEEKDGSTPIRKTGGEWRKLTPDGKGGVTTQKIEGKEHNVVPK
jgi:RHS repeat-associated protein